MVTSNQMRRGASIILALILLLGGICGGLCFAQMPGDGAAHSCCQHGKDHCGHGASPSIDGHAAVAMVKIAPMILTEPVVWHTFASTPFETVVAQPLSDSSPPF